MHAIYLGVSGFPYGMAAIQRQILVSKSLILQGWEVTIICNRSPHSKNAKVLQDGDFEGIKYRYIYNPYRSKHLAIRGLRLLLSPFIEMYNIYKINKKDKIHLAIISNGNLIISNFRYYIISRLLNFKLVVNLVEDYSNRENRSVFNRLNNNIFNKYGLLYCDGYLPISHFLIEKHRHFKKNYIYMPVIVNIDMFNLQSQIKIPDQKFFLYCGAAAYVNSIQLILEAFALSTIPDTRLILITEGSSNEIEKIKFTCTRLRISEKVDIKSKLPYEELVGLMQSALALLLPMFDTIQDTARFPHKLGEYLASKRPVITNNIGELKFFLTDRENSIFFKTDDAADFANKMDWIGNNTEAATQIGLNGYNTAIKHFDYKALSVNLSKFILNEIINYKRI